MFDALLGLSFCTLCGFTPNHTRQLSCFACFAKRLLFNLFCMLCYTRPNLKATPKYQPIAWIIFFLFKICVRSKHAKSCNSNNQVIEHCQPIFTLDNGCEGVLMSSMLLTFHVNDIVCQNLNLPHLLSLSKKPFFVYENFKFFTWFINMVQ